VPRACSGDIMKSGMGRRRFLPGPACRRRHRLGSACPCPIEDQHE
jgi:hypothetical protein